MEFATPTARPKSGFYIPALDGLRLVAFLMVWWAHALPGPDAANLPPIPLYGGFLLSGTYGVSVFFVLSAYLITRLLLTEREKNGRIDIRAFYVRRTLRIWPLYFLVVGITTAESIFHVHQVYPGELLALCTFTANWYRVFVGEIHSFAAVLWSVSVEEQFYLVWPFVIAFGSRSSLRNLSVAMIAVAFLARIAVFVAQQRGMFPVKDPYFGMENATTSHLDSLGFGTLLALAGDRLPKLGGWKWYASFFACLGALVVHAQWFPTSFRVTPLGFRDPVGFSLVPPVAAAMVALALNAKGTFLEWRPAVALGRITFGMYCYHLWVLEHVRGGPEVRLPASLFFTVGVAWLSYQLYEGRFLRLKNRFERISTRPT